MSSDFGENITVKVAFLFGNILDVFAGSNSIESAKYIDSLLFFTLNVLLHYLMKVLKIIKVFH